MTILLRLRIPQIISMAALLWVLLLLMSCRITKQVHKSTADSVGISRDLVTNLAKGTVTTHDSGTWYRHTWEFPPPVVLHDTFHSRETNTIAQPQNYYYTQPVRYIDEGGKNYSRTDAAYMDSFVKAKLDSASRHSTAVTVDKKTAPVGGWLVLFILGGAFIIGFVWDIIKHYNFMRIGTK